MSKKDKTKAPVAEEAQTETAPPADASAHAYVLDMVVESETVKP